MKPTDISILLLTACLSATLPACGGTPSDEPVGEVSQAASDIFMRISGVDGESKEGGVTRWQLLDGGILSADVITDCDGPWCRVVTATAAPVSGHTDVTEGPTSVWELTATGSDSVPWGAHLVVRRPPHAGPVVETKRVDVSGLALGGGTGGSAPVWSSMAPANAVDCATPNCGSVEFPEEGWECLPVCTLLGKGPID